MSYESNVDSYTTIATLNPDQRNVSVQFKVLSIDEPRRIFSKSLRRPIRIANSIIADSTASIRMTLWNDDLDDIQVGRTYILKDGSVKIYEERLILTRGRRGEFIQSSDSIDIVNDTFNLSKPFLFTSKKKKKKRSKSGKSFSTAQGREHKGYCTFKKF